MGLARAATVMAAVGLALAGVTSPEPEWAILGVGAGLAGIAGGVALDRISRSEKAGVCLLVPALLILGFSGGYLIGGLRAASIGESPLKRHIGANAYAELTVTGDVKLRNGWQSAAVAVRRLKIGTEEVPEAQGEKVWLEVPPTLGSSGQGQTLMLERGLVLGAQVSLREPQSKSESGYDERRYLLCEGVSVVLRARPASARVLGRRDGIGGWLDSLRLGARRHLNLGPDERINASLAGVVLGDTSGMDRQWLESFRRAGTAHMFAVSGLHVGSVVGMAMGLAWTAGLPRWAGPFFGAAAAGFMVVLAGGSASCVRAAVMIVLMLVARAFGRRRDSWQTLGLAAIVVLGLNPFAIYDAGFQLSFAAVAGILAIAGSLQQRLASMTWIPEALRVSVPVSVAAAIGTTPVALWAFGRASLISPVANLVVVPVLPVVVGLGLTSALAGFIWHGLSVFLDHLVAAPLVYAMMVSRLLGMVPVLDAATVGNLICAVLGAAVVAPIARALLGHVPRVPAKLGLRFLGAVARKARGWRRRRPRLVAACAAALLIIGAGAGAFSYPPLARALAEVRAAVHTRAWPQYPELAVLDVGQGNAILLRTPRHGALLFDGGPADCHLSEQLRTMGIDTLDALVVSHPHVDHFAGAKEALDSIDVELLVDCVEFTEETAIPGATNSPASSSGGTSLPGESTSPDAAAYYDFRKLLEQTGCRHMVAHTGDSLDLHGVKVKLFAPEQPLLLDASAESGEMALRLPGQGSAASNNAVNAASVVALLTVGELDVLLPGDAEADVLSQYALPPAEVVVVPHHGSRDALSRSLLRRLNSRVAVISVGKNNSFGHPAAQTLSFLEECKATILRTDTCGRVCCLLKEDHLTVRCERNERGK